MRFLAFHLQIGGGGGVTTCRNLFIIISSMNKKWPQLCGACWGTCLHFYSTYTFINDSYVSDKFAGHKVQMCGKKRRLKYSKKKSFLLGIGQKKGGVAGPTIFKHVN